MITGLQVIFVVGFVVVMITIFMWLTRPFRAFEKELKLRTPVPDDKLAALYFEGSTIPPDVPVRVRRLFAKHTSYEFDRLLPDDDLMFFWEDLDGAPLIEDIEREFGVTISAVDAETTKCTIREVAKLVERLRSANSTAPSRGAATAGSQG